MPKWQPLDGGQIVAHYLIADAIRYKLACFKPAGGVHYSVSGVGPAVARALAAEFGKDTIPTTDATRRWAGQPFAEAVASLTRQLAVELPKASRKPANNLQVAAFCQHLHRVEHVVNAGLLHAYAQLSPPERATVLRQLTGAQVSDDVEVAALHPYPSSQECQDDGMFWSPSDGTVTMLEIKVNRGNAKFDLAQLAKYANLTCAWKERGYLTNLPVDLLYIEPQEHDRIGRDLDWLAGPTATARHIEPNQWQGLVPTAVAERYPALLSNLRHIRFTRTTFEKVRDVAHRINLASSHAGVLKTLGDLAQSARGQGLLA